MSKTVFPKMSRARFSKKVATRANNICYHFMLWLMKSRFCNKIFARFQDFVEVCSFWTFLDFLKMSILQKVNRLLFCVFIKVPIKLLDHWIKKSYNHTNKYCIFPPIKLLDALSDVFGHFINRYLTKLDIFYLNTL